MYVTTFYSFKGGVGRTMALMNVALDLVNKGRRVLVVDFDLEAPGVGTFGMIGTKAPAAGVVEFIESYLSTGETPDVTQYVSNVHGSEAGGQLFLMPAGHQDQSYGERLAAIDWGELYGRKDGFLLLEDLKVQWKRSFAPDYVLIDSRTGHTDVAGICTRQLPDAVVILFFPNEQNLAGLRKIVKDIRSEEDPPTLHFVPSNVPDLDDEDQILSNRLMHFRADLDYEKPAATIHHNNSLALLNQILYVEERPRSALTREYQLLTKAIQQGNGDDADGVVSVLDELYEEFPRGAGSPPAVDKQLKDVWERHASNEQVLYRVLRIYMRLGEYKAGLRIIDQLIEQVDKVPAEYFFRRASLRLNVEGAGANVKEDLHAGLQSKEANYFDLKLALNLIQRAQLNLYQDLAVSPALMSLGEEDQRYIFKELAHIKEAQPCVVPVLQERLKEADDSKVRSELAGYIAICFIGAGRFEEAAHLYQSMAQDVADMDVDDAYNCAMAMWGATGTPSEAHLRHTLQVADEGDVGFEGANWWQCLSMAAQLLGDSGRALDCLSRARLALDREPVPIFSGWRYCYVGVEDFLKDLNEQGSFIAGGKAKPAFLTGQSLALPLRAQSSTSPGH